MKLIAADPSANAHSAKEIVVLMYIISTSESACIHHQILYTHWIEEVPE